MAVTYATAVKTARLNATRTYFFNGTIEIMSAGNVVLAILTFSATGGSVTTTAWTLGFVANTVNGQVAAGAGTTATKAQFKNSAAVVGLTGLTVGLAGSGADIELINTSISSGQPITITSAVINHAA